MQDLATIARLESAGYTSSRSTLADAFRMLMERWTGGARDRETGLRLLFLTWYDCADPPYLPPDEPRHSFESLFETLGGEGSADAELLYVVGVMGRTAEFCCGSADRWERLAPRLLARSLELQPDGPTPEQFADRGAFGLYFEHIVRWPKRFGAM